MNEWLDKIRIIAIRCDGVDKLFPEPWRASRFDGERKLTMRRDDKGDPVVDERTKDPVFIPNPEQLCRFKDSLEIELLSGADIDLAVVLVAKVDNGSTISAVATNRIGLPAWGTCLVELRRSGGVLVEHQLQINAFELEPKVAP